MCGWDCLAVSSHVAHLPKEEQEMSEGPYKPRHAGPRSPADTQTKYVGRHRRPVAAEASAQAATPARATA